MILAFPLDDRRKNKTRTVSTSDMDSTFEVVGSVAQRGYERNWKSMFHKT
jgi:hypothetical protein